MAKFWRFSGRGGQGLEKVSIFTAKGTSMRESTSFAIFPWKLVGGVTSRSVGEKIKKVTNIVYFTYLPRSPRCSDRHQICSVGWLPGRNQLCQILFQSVQGFWFCRGWSNFGLSHGNEVSPLTQGLNYRSACDSIMYFLLTSYTLITFSKVLSHFITKIKIFTKYFKEVVLTYFKISMTFLNTSKWNMSSCIPSGR